MSAANASSCTPPMITSGPLAALAITSILLPHVRMLQQNNFEHSLFSRPLMLPLRAYYNGDGDCPNLANVTYVSLDEVQPWAGWYVKRHTDRASWIQRAYARGRLKCTVAWEYMRSHICKDVVTVYKVAAIRDAVVSRIARHIVWLDIDTFFQRDLDARFWQFVTRFDIVSIGRKRYVDKKGMIVGGEPDTGVTVFDTASEATHHFCDRWEAGYTNLTIQLAAGGVNDITLFRHFLHDGGTPDMRFGIFGVACREDAPHDQQWVVDSLHYSSKCRFCPDELPDVSSYNLFEYITHVKGRQGPIVFRNGTQRLMASASRSIALMRNRSQMDRKVRVPRNGVRAASMSLTGKRRRARKVMANRGVNSSTVLCDT